LNLSDGRAEYDRDTTHFHPPINSGLSGEDTYLSEHVELQGYTPSELRSPGVYALVLSVPGNVNQEDHWLAEYESLPSYWSELTSSERVVYVGAAKDVYGRLLDHVEGEVRQTALTRVYPPHTLLKVWLYDGADEAFLRESNHAIELANEHEHWFVQQA